MPQEQVRCENCRFWQQIMNTVKDPYNGTLKQVPLPFGACHAGPPVSHEWPQKAPDDWCGQFQPLPAKEVKG